MNSWIHLFSKFTTEALLIEFLAICGLTAAYTAFWINRKRRLGAVKDAVPANLVRGYLNELISQAQLIRTQLFGLLADAGVSLPENAGIQAEQLLQALRNAESHAAATGAGMPASVAGAAAGASVAGTPVMATGATAAALIAADPELKNKLTDLESKLASQAKAMESMVSEKTKIMKELELAKSATAGKGGDTGAANSGETDELKKKIQALEEKLAEYSVIEDDLANLKKLQQENAQLRAALAGKGGNPTDTVAAIATPTPSPAVASAPVVSPAPVEAAPAPTEPTKEFEAAVDQVEAEIAEPAQESAPQAAAAPAPADQPAASAETPAPAEAASTPADAPANIVKSDDDLLSEFEKMLES